MIERDVSNMNVELSFTKFKKGKSFNDHFKPS